jgi:hypothetical protein
MVTSDERRRRSSRAHEVGGHIGQLYLLSGTGSPYELRIDPEGRWFHGGVEIVRRNIMQLFSRGLRRGKDGKYYVRLGRDEAPVIVEDAPFVVLRVEEQSPGKLRLLLSDGSDEILQPRTLVFRDDNIPYCLVRKNLEAKFSRQAYYQLAKYIEHDEASGSYYFHVGRSRRKLNISGQK